jgi:hypothetical protein
MPRARSACALFENVSPHASSGANPSSLNAHGLSAVGPRHTLQNLKRIFDARRMIAADAKTHEIDE